MSTEYKDSTYDSNELDTAEMTIKFADVPRYYTTGNVLDLRDLVIHVRSKYPNPWQKVILDGDNSLPTADLEGMRIYIRGKNDGKAHTISGLGRLIYLPLCVTAENSPDTGCGLLEKLAEYSTAYQIDDFEVLVYGTDVDSLQRVWEFVQSHSEIKQKVYFPPLLIDSVKLFDDGIDLAPYAKRFHEASIRRELTSTFIKSVLDELRGIIRSGKVRLQDFEDTRSKYAKWLTVCLTQEMNLAPVYLVSYVSEYVDLRISYPFTKLSFFERFNFVRKLPQNVGYIPHNQELASVFSILRKVYPHPYLAFDLDTGDVLTSNLNEKFDLNQISILDYRTMFSSSSSDSTIVNSDALAVSSVRDEEVNKKLIDIFTRATEASPDRNIFMSVRNTALTSVGGHTYLLYFTEPFGLGGIFQSPYVGNHSMVIGEDNFHRLIDVKIILAEQKRQASSTQSEGQNVFTQIMALDTQFRPAIDPYILMCSELARLQSKDLSYYDRRLRCDKCVLPIVTHVDSPLSSSNSVFSGARAEDHIDLVTLRYDKVGSAALTAFGGLNSDLGYYDKLPVSTDSFWGCKLL